MYWGSGLQRETDTRTGWAEDGVVTGDMGNSANPPVVPRPRETMPQTGSDRSMGGTGNCGPSPFRPLYDVSADMGVAC